MANLFTVTIRANEKYVDIAEFAGVTLEAGKDYSIQVLGNAYICESEEEPKLGQGFLMTTKDKPFGFTAGENTKIWALTPKAVINLAD